MVVPSKPVACSRSRTPSLPLLSPNLDGDKSRKHGLSDEERNEDRDHVAPPTNDNPFSADDRQRSSIT
jgi:hypothetical protein